MGVSPLGDGPIGIGTSVLIYYVEENAQYVARVDALVAYATARDIEFVTSAISLLEVLVIPIRAGNRALAERYETLLARVVRLVDVDRDQLRTAATLRAHHGVRTPDALQLAAALTTGCSAFVTNDLGLRDLPGLRVVQLRDVA